MGIHTHIHLSAKQCLKSCRKWLKLKLVVKPISTECPIRIVLYSKSVKYGHKKNLGVFLGWD